MNDEKTVYSTENPGVANKVTVNVVSDKEKTQQPVEKKSGSKVGAAIIGAGAGLVLGSVSSFFTSQASPKSGLLDIDDPQAPFEEPVKMEQEAEQEVELLQQPEWADESVAIATSVTDDMSFSEAFAAARAEVGPGGAFEWNGMAYGTYTAEEWESMTPEEKAEYNDKFDWSKIDADDDYTAEDVSVLEPEYLPADDDDDDDAEELVADSYDEVDEDVDVEVLDLQYDEESGMNFATITIDNEEMLLVDIDNDEVYDVLAYDADADGIVTEDELIDVSEEGLSVSMLTELDEYESAMESDSLDDFAEDEYDIV